jgi:predicted nuclease of restriction endonuclease-like RecB superfamily
VLTADLVVARRYKGELRVPKLEGAARDAAEAVAAAYIALAEDHVGRTRDDLEAAWGAVPTDACGARLAAGIRKLVDDGCEFDADPEVDAPALRGEVFLRASAERRALEDGGVFDRTRILSDVARARECDVAAVERALYADLRGANVVRVAPRTSARDLVLGYDRAQAQAVLLRAVRVRCDVRCASAGATRALFRKLKFLRLLHTIRPAEDAAAGDGAYHVVVDGPFSLFDSVTKYGLKLAMLVPCLEEVDEWSMEAEIRWGKDRTPLVFRLSGGVASGMRAAPEDARLPDDVALLREGIARLGSPFAVRPAMRVIDLPGVGLCVPDLVFVHAESGAEVFLEVMGYWSRDAVWKRVELAQGGLADKVLFAVSSRLRVSAEVLPDDAPAALYVYKGVMSPRAVIDRVAELARR